MPSPKDLVPLATGAMAPPTGAQLVGEVDPKEIVQVTVRIRPYTPIQKLRETVQALGTKSPAQRKHMTREEFAEKHGARDLDIEKVEEYAKNSGLTVTESSTALRSVRLQGTAEAMNKAFGVGMKKYQHRGKTFRIRTDQVKVPKDLASIVEAIIGFDTRPRARPHFRIAGTGAKQPQARPESRAFTPLEVAQLYNFPANTDGTGQVIGIIELTADAGSGFRLQELKQYYTSLGVGTPEIITVSVDGAQNQPGTNPNDPNCADGEVMLDLEVAGAIAPKAKIVVYFAPNTPQGFLDVINQAVHDSKNKPNVISISWGAPENPNDQSTDQINQILQAAAAMGVTICIASGDNGSRDNADEPNQAAVDFPASSPWALACGGTQLVGTGNTITSEIAWNDADGGATGGGVSRLFDLPDYQAKANIPPAVNPAGPARRGVPDVAGNAAGSTGYKILVDGITMTIGGTSAVAPLWAALIARLNQQLGRPMGFINPILYANMTALNDIVQGTNGDFKAGRGWDPCTGLGSPNGTKLLNILAAPVAAAAAGTK